MYACYLHQIQFLFNQIYEKKKTYAPKCCKALKHQMCQHTTSTTISPNIQHYTQRHLTKCHTTTPCVTPHPTPPHVTPHTTCNTPPHNTHQHFYVFLFLRALIGVGEASYSTIAPTIMADLFKGASRTRAFSIFYFAIPVGGSVGLGVVGSRWVCGLGRRGGGVRKWSFGGGGVVGEPVGYGYVEGSMSGLRFDWRSQL